eukprot:UN06536
MRLLVTLCLWLFYVNAGQEDVQTVEVDSSGQQSDDPNALTVIFENQSGGTVELWSDNATTVSFKAKLENTDKITRKATIGQNFYFTVPNSGGSKERVLYQKIMKKLTKKVVLFDRKKMKTVEQRDDIGCDGSECKIIFANKSGQTLKVYWEGQKGSVFQGTVMNNDEMTQYTHIGHKFYFTPNKNTNDKKDRIKTITVTKDTAVVTVSK